MEPRSHGGHQPYVAHPLPPEVFIIVRPPPSKQTDPRNLQIQLLVASSRPIHPHAVSSLQGNNESSSSVGAVSFDAVAGATVDGPATMMSRSGSGSSSASGGRGRSSSMRSGRSASSTSSVVPNSAGATGAGVSGAGGRRVTPLYNLGFHAILPTVVTDAGTDQRIAKFLKRGIEIIGFAVLDPVDLRNYPPKTSTPTPKAPSTPATSADSPSLPVGAGGGGLLSKLKKFSFKPPSMIAKPGSATEASSSSSQPPTNANVVPLYRTTSALAGADDSTPRRRPRSASRQRGSMIKDPPSVPRGYAFQVRKFLRNDIEGPPTNDRMIRFEWKRAEKQKRRKSKGGSKADETPKGRRREASEPMMSGGREGRRSMEVQRRARGSFEASRSILSTSPPSATMHAGGMMMRTDQSGSISPSALNFVSVGQEEEHEDPNELVPRRRESWVPGGVGGRTGGRKRGGSMSGPSMAVPIPASATTTTTTYDSSASSSASLSSHMGERQGSPEVVEQRGATPGAGTEEPVDQEEEDEDEEDSDLEDSDRSWWCTLHPTSTDATTPPQPLVLATLTPAPHHPRLVAHLSLPSSLRPVALGSSRAVGTLSVEEMKDVVSVTALWLIVREGLGRTSGKAGKRGRKGSEAGLSAE